VCNRRAAHNHEIGVAEDVDRDVAGGDRTGASCGYGSSQRYGRGSARSPEARLLVRGVRAQYRDFAQASEGGCYPPIPTIIGVDVGAGEPALGSTVMAKVFG